MKQQQQQDSLFILPKSVPLFNWANSSLKNKNVKREFYAELDEFRQNRDHSPYRLHERRTGFYRIIFFSFSFLFLVLLGFVIKQTTTGYCFILGYCQYIKPILITLSSLLSIFSFSIGFYMKPQREAVVHFHRTAVQQLKKLYMQQCTKQGWQRFFLFSNTHTQARFIKLSYQHTLRQMTVKKDETLILLDQLYDSHELDPAQRIKLYDQAIFELQDKFQEMVDSFTAQVQAN